MEEDQSKTEVTSNRGQLPRAPRWRGGLDVLLNMEGLMAGRPNGNTGPRARGRGRTRHTCRHTHSEERDGHKHTQSLKQR